MRRTECVVHVVIAKASQLLGEVGIVGLFFRVEAEVLQQQRLAAFQLFGHFFGLYANAVGRKANILAATQNIVNQNAQPLGDRFEAHLGIGLAFGPSQVGSENQTRAMPQRVFDRRQGFANARVVHDTSIVEWDVEVNTHKDALIVERKIANGELCHISSQ